MAARIYVEDAKFNVIIIRVRNKSKIDHWVAALEAVDKHGRIFYLYFTDSWPSGHGN
jgi:hypothetical protein